LKNEVDSQFRNQLSSVTFTKAGYPVLITPHVVRATYKSMHDTEEFIVDKFIKI